jgi:putative sigma-54 modulation protein
MSRKSSKAEEFVQEGYDFNFTVTGRNIEVTEAMRNYSLEKISKIERFNIPIIDIVVTMDVQKAAQRCEMLVHVNHTIIKSQAITEDMYASIDQAADKLQTQFRRYHQRMREHRGKGISEIESDIEQMNVNVFSSEGSLDQSLLDVNDQIEEENQRKLAESHRSPKVVKKDKMAIKLLTYNEALVKMDFSDEPFMLFRCEEDNKLKIIYRREDGNFGIVEPQA